MGADGWDDAGPWHDDPNESLRALQRQRLAQQYNLPRFIAERLANARQALESTRDGHNPPSLRDHLLAVYGADVAYLEAVQAGPLPTDLDRQLEIVRRVCGADGCGGVLDVTGVGEAGGFTAARRLSAAELMAACGTGTPTGSDIRGGLARLPHVGRGESICFPLYDQAGTGVGWRFAGCAVD